MADNKLEEVDVGAGRLVREWQITIQTPLGGLDNLLSALGRELGLVQGAYDNCLYVRGGGAQRFRAREGAHGGAEDTVQETAAAEIVFCVDACEEMLKKVFDVIFENHVQEEPTVWVQEVMGSRSNYLDDKDNPNRYWNRPNAKEIHGEAITKENK